MTDEEFATKLKDAQARKAKAEASLVSPDAELARAERDAADAEAIVKAAADYGADEITTVPTDQGVVILKRAHSAAMRRFMDRDPAKTKIEDIEALVRPCVVYPDVVVYDAMVEKQPLIATRCGKALAQLAGAEREAQAGKS